MIQPCTALVPYEPPGIERQVRIEKAAASFMECEGDGLGRAHYLTIEAHRPCSPSLPSPGIIYRDPSPGNLDVWA